MANKMTPMAVVVFLVALILGTSTTAQGAFDQCLGLVTTIIIGCRNNLGTNPTSISTQCCDALRNVVDDGDVCKCLQELKHHPSMASTFLSSKAQQLSGTCNLPVISPILKCLVPKDIRIPFPGPPISIRLPPLTDLLPPITLPFPPPSPADPPATTKTVSDESSKDIIITLPPVSLPFPSIPFPLPPFTGFLPPISLPFPPPTPADPPAITKTVSDESSKDIIITLPPVSLPFPSIPFPLPPFTGFLPPISRPFPPPTPAALPAAPPTS